MVDKIENCFIINAPAGSGKTTRIRAMVEECIASNSLDNVLCITYTNRAADELSKDIRSKNVYVGTIHAFLHSYMKRFFAHKDIIELFFEIYGEKIIQRIENAGCDERIDASNKKYIEKYGKIDYETVKKNIKEITYNESSFSSLLYGGLSHDDLILFSKIVFERYPIVKKGISHKYQYIFIDEYQDTMSAVLKIFFESVVGTNTKLYLFGDRMQQIYKNYDGSFEEQFKLFDDTYALTTNYRSVKSIIDILNKIYNVPSFIQNDSEQMKAIKEDFKPRVILSKDVRSTIKKIRANDPNTLVLYLFNRERFSDIGAGSLFDAFNGMDRYSFGKTYSASDILTTLYDDNPDALLKLLLCLVGLKDYYTTCKYGIIVQILKRNPSLFNRDNLNIRNHDDKERLFSCLSDVFSVLDDETKTISDLLNCPAILQLTNSDYLEGIYSDEDYSRAFGVPAIEILNVYEYLKDPKISTQHGVKGESHESVLFVAENSSNTPITYMYRFFDMWANMDISLNEFNQFYYSYIHEINDLQNSIGMKVNELNKDAYIVYEQTIKDKVSQIIQKFADNRYFSYICKESYVQYLEKPGVTKAKSCLKESSVLGILSAYKLFYVGCSRARKNLTVLLDESQIVGDYELQKNRFSLIGFTLI